MATFVAVSDQNLSTKADEKGRYQINDLAFGTYELSIWNIRGEVKRTIEIKANDALSLTDRIDTAAFKIESPSTQAFSLANSAGIFTTR